MEVNFTVKDTSNQYVIQTDTLLFTYREKSTRKKKKTAERPMLEKLQVINHSQQRDTGPAQETWPLTLNLPLKAIRDSLISLYQIPDSVEITNPFKLAADTSLLTRAWISS